MSDVMHRRTPSGAAGVSQDEQQLQALEQERAAAELHGDVAFFQRVLADDFIGVGPLGFMLTREQWWGRYASGDYKSESFTWDEATIRLYGDAAVVVGRESGKATYQGRETGGRFRATHVWVRQAGAWQLAGLHLSPIMQPPPR